MKKLALTLCLAALATGAFAQGTVNFLNNASMLISANGTAATGPAGTWVYGLFTAPEGSTLLTEYSFAGIYATNQTVAGRLTGGANVAVAGWAAGATKAFMVRGWSSNLGWDWNTVAPLFTGQGSYAGTIQPDSVIGTSALALRGVAGGPLPAPAFNLWGGSLGLQAGFNMVPVPEPSSFALAGLGAAAMLIFRRRK